MIAPLASGVGAAEASIALIAAGVVQRGAAAVGEDLVRERRMAHGLAGYFTVPTTDITLVLRPRGLASSEPVQVEVERARMPELRTGVAESDAELAIRDALYEVIDPDLGVNVVDLGFVRRVELTEDGLATITMTLTSAACPLTAVMEGSITKVLGETATRFEINWEFMPPWQPSEISPEGKEQLKAVGFNGF